MANQINCFIENCRQNRKWLKIKTKCLNVLILIRWSQMYAYLVYLELNFLLNNDLSQN